MKNQESPTKSNNGKITASRIEVSILGMLGGFISIEHGIFEVLQGNIPTNGILINAIAPGHWYWKEGGELAMTFIPNFLITGIVAIIIGIFTIIWSIGFVHRKFGALGLFTLTILTLLFGGGIAFFILGILISIIATRINSSLMWWENHLPSKIKKFLSKLWFPIFTVSVIIFIFLVLGGIFGVWFLDPNNATTLLSYIGLISIGLIIFAFLCGFAYDIN
ncbi:MAG: hypothetical protein ACFFBP_00085 [Promethearchaeota archaeon]